jgi:uncharacterized protein
MSKRLPQSRHLLIFAAVLTDDQIIEQTEKWIRSVVIGCNFCPFASRALQQQGIRYRVARDSSLLKSKALLLEEAALLDGEPGIETTLIIFPDRFLAFRSYLDLLRQSEQVLARKGYDGIYQVASFHPDYCFAGADPEDAANYTNRSVYPMLHLLREQSITRALKFFPDPESIPERNIAFSREKGLAYMQMLLAACSA